MQRRFRSSISSVFDESRGLDRCLEDGWNVVMCNQIDDRTLEYIIEKPGHRKACEALEKEEEK